MKTKNHIISLLLLVFASFPLLVQAEEVNFPAGSLIIPMDATYQPEADGGLLEAYGLVFYLLQHKNTDDEHDITLYWIINQEKTAIDGSDFVIEDLTVSAVNPVAVVYDHDGTTSPLTYKTGDSFKKVTYNGAPFIIGEEDAARAKLIINSSSWSAVEVHEAKVPFAAMVHQELRGTPPRIALMNDSEDKTKGNAQILESYLRLAGICTDVYDVVTPCEISDGVLKTGDYDYLWAPHWTGYDKYDEDGFCSDIPHNSIPDVEDIVLKVKEFLIDGKALLAECASIEVFEHSENGHFLTDKGFAHDGGYNDPDHIIPNDFISPYSQVGDFIYAPEGGHIHNWRPFQAGDETVTSVEAKPKTEAYGFVPIPDVSVASGGASVYNDTVTRFVTDDAGWDYYVGGRAFGDTNNGYVLYLGGHAYADCKASTTEVVVTAEVHLMEFEFEKDFDHEIMELKVDYLIGTLGTPASTTITVDVTENPFTVVTGGTLTEPLEIDFTTARVDHHRKFKDVTFRNTGSADISIDAMTFSWTGGKSDQLSKKGIDLYLDRLLLWDHVSAPSGERLDHEDFTIETSYTGGASTGCSDNGDCTWKNIAGVRYILNALFNIRSTIISHEYVRAAPIIKFPYLYQGTFEYPSWEGHFRRFNVMDNDTDGAATYLPEDADWDTADGGVPSFDTRDIYTTQQDINGDWPKIAFTLANMSTLRALLDVTPLNGVDTDEEAVIRRVRGERWDPDLGATGEWVEKDNRLGGIEHSAPVIVDSGRGGDRAEMAYVGDMHGLMHAIETSSGDEKWAYIPSKTLSKLQNDRTDENAAQDFAGVDGSPTAVDVFYDPPNVDGTDKSWRTILSGSGGKGGQYLYALDVTDPREGHWSILWEYTGDTIINYTGSDTDASFFTTGETVTGATSGATGVIISNDTANGDLTIKVTSGTFASGEVISTSTPPKTVTVNKVVEMGNGSRVSIGKLRWPIKDVDDVDGDGDTDEIIGYEPRYMAFVSTGFTNITDSHGGINVFAVDLQTGERLWYFSEPYLDSVNDIPGAITLYDKDGDNFVDRLYMGDMNGRLWELDAMTGENPHGTETVDGVVRQIPLWNAGVGNPISVSPAIIKKNDSAIIVFGTGGTDWAANDSQYKVYAIATTPNPIKSYADGGGTPFWLTVLPVGEKVWSAPTIFKNMIYIATATGSMEGVDPKDDIASGAGKLRVFSLNDGSEPDAALDIGKVRGSIYIDREQIYMTTIDNQIVRIGDGSFSEDIKRASIKAWHHVEE